MYIERGRGATFVASELHLFQLSVAFDEFLRPATGETDGEPSVLVVAFDTDDSADTIARMANLLSKKRIRIRAASHRRARVRA